MVLHPNDDDPAVAAPEPHLPLLSNDDDITEPWPVPCPLIKRIHIEPKTSCPPPPFNNNSHNSYNISNPPPDQSVSSSDLQNQKKRRHISEFIYRIRKKSSSNNKLDLKWKNRHVMVKVRTTPADITKLENNTRIIPQEEAVCRFCFHQLFLVNNNNNNNVIKTKCLCPFTLTHHNCATEWSRTKGNIKCDVCDQDTIYIPVTLSTPPLTSEEKPDKGSFVSTLKKWSCFTTG